MMAMMATNLKGDLGEDGIASLVWATVRIGNDGNINDGNGNNGSGNNGNDGNDGDRNKPEGRPRWRGDCLNSVGNGDNWSFLFLLLSHVNHVVGDCSRSLPE